MDASASRPLSSTVNDPTGCFLSPVSLSQPQKYKTGGSYGHSACYGVQVWPDLPTYSVGSSHTRSLLPYKQRGRGLYYVLQRTRFLLKLVAHTLSHSPFTEEGGGGLLLRLLTMVSLLIARTLCEKSLLKPYLTIDFVSLDPLYIFYCSCYYILSLTVLLILYSSCLLTIVIFYSFCLLTIVISYSFTLLLNKVSWSGVYTPTTRVRRSRPYGLQPMILVQHCWNLSISIPQLTVSIPFLITLVPSRSLCQLGLACAVTPSKNFLHFLHQDK